METETVSFPACWTIRCQGPTNQLVMQDADTSLVSKREAKDPVGSKHPRNVCNDRHFASLPGELASPSISCFMSRGIFTFRISKVSSSNLGDFTIVSFGTPEGKKKRKESRFNFKNSCSRHALIPSVIRSTQNALGEMDRCSTFNTQNLTSLSQFWSLNRQIKSHAKSDLRVDAICLSLIKIFFFLHTW